MNIDPLRDIRDVISDDLSIKELRQILTRHCMRMLLASGNQKLDTSTDWGFRLLQSCLVLSDAKSLMGENSERRMLRGLQRSMGSPLDFYNAGGNRVKLLATGVISNLTFAIHDLLSERLKPSKKKLTKVLAFTLTPSSYSEQGTASEVDDMLSFLFTSLSADLDTAVEGDKDLRACPLFSKDGRYERDLYPRGHRIYEAIPEDLSGHQFWRDWLRSKVAGKVDAINGAKEISKIGNFGKISKDRKIEIDRQLEMMSSAADAQEEHSPYRLRDSLEGQVARIGSSEEYAARSAVLEQLTTLRDDLPKPDSHGGFGHNRPPSEFELRGDELESATKSVNAIEAELTSENPSVGVVAAETSRLEKVIGWIGGKVGLTVDAFCKSFGTTLGVTAAVGLPPALLAKPYWGDLVALLGRLKDWLTLVLGG